MMDNKPFAMFFNASPRKGWKRRRNAPTATRSSPSTSPTPALSAGVLSKKR